MAALAACVLGLGSASCVTGGSAPTTAAQLEQAVTIPMADGAANALLFRPASGSGPWPAVLVYTDLAGLRPAYAEIGRSLARQGYVVLIPNAFYRSAAIDGTTQPGPLSPEQLRERSTIWTGAITDDAAKQDATAYIAFLDALPAVSRRAKAGVIGYNYGAPYAFHAATAMPDRIGAVAVLHPFRIATARPNSPHLAVRRSKASYYVAIAQPDDVREPADKDDLRKAFADARLRSEVEVFAGPQGFAVSDDAGYRPALADTAWGKTTALLRATLR
jgi:carboxymethylenebutenolidase